MTKEYLLGRLVLGVDWEDQISKKNRETFNDEYKGFTLSYSYSFVSSTFSLILKLGSHQVLEEKRICFNLQLSLCSELRIHCLGKKRGGSITMFKKYLFNIVGQDKEKRNHIFFRPFLMILIFPGSNKIFLIKVPYFLFNRVGTLIVL